MKSLEVVQSRVVADVELTPRLYLDGHKRHAASITDPHGYLRPSACNMTDRLMP